MLSKDNFLIALAPYFFPFYTGLVIALWYGVGFFYDLSRWEAWWLVLVGVTWGFHVTFTVYMLSQKQSDVLENGRLFSYVIIYLTNLFFVALWIVLIGVPTFSDAWPQLCRETVYAYNVVWLVGVKGWLQLKNFVLIKTGS
jgi:hypothetical protein